MWGIATTTAALPHSPQPLLHVADESMSILCSLSLPPLLSCRALPTVPHIYDNNKNIREAIVIATDNNGTPPPPPHLSCASSPLLSSRQNTVSIVHQASMVHVQGDNEPHLRQRHHSPSIPRILQQISVVNSVFVVGPSHDPGQ